MKRYVNEVANDCKRELKSSMQFALDFDTLTAENEEEIRKEYTRKLARIDELVNQCQYGYIPDLIAVELIVSV